MRRYPLDLIQHLAYPVLDEETGQYLNFRQLMKHPVLSKIWKPSASNELGRLCQGVGTSPNGQGKRVEGTNTFFVTRYEDIPPERRKEITYTSIVCEVRPQKADPNRTRITIGGNLICYPGEVSTPTASLELVKLMLNSVLSRKGAKFACFDISNFYLGTPLPRPEYVRMKIADIPQEFIDEYNLHKFVRDGWIYFKIVRGVYGLPQSGKLAYDQLRTRLEAAGYFEAVTTPGFWRHKWRPIQFCLIVDDFGIEYIGKQHADHLANVLRKYHDITTDWEGSKFAGINLAWNYSKRECRLTMEGYIRDLLLKYGHPIPAKPQHSPHKHIPISYGAKQQFSPEADTSQPLDEAGIKRVQGIVGALLYCGRAVNDKILVALSDIGSQQAIATQHTKDAVTHLLDYVATYPNDGITYRASDMVLASHSDASYLNVSKSRSRGGSYIFCSKNDAIPKLNGSILTLAKIIKFVMSSAAEAELAALFMTAKEMVPLRRTLVEMGWPQPKSPIQVDNTTAVGVTNKTLVPKQTKSMDMRFYWLRCRMAQGQFRVYWAPGPTNEADYTTKHHPPQHHLTVRNNHFRT